MLRSSHTKPLPPPRLAKAEPEHGCYVSVFVGPDHSLRKAMHRYGGTLEDAIARLLHKEIAAEWVYFNYDNPFEVQGYLQIYKNRPFVLQIALEPNHGLSEVRDDETLRLYAQMMAAYGRPVFLRFASEMNGAWTPYHGNPAAYRHTFRLVAQTMKRLAPNVVMVWCVNHQPLNSLDSYYPGDDCVDWVGVNFYSVLHHNGDINQPADKEDPASLLDGVYRKYAHKKPIAICEYGATRQESLAPEVDQSEWAAQKLTRLLTVLPQKYPRVKMVGLFNVNTMQPGFQSASVKRNNFCFSDAPIVCDALQRALQSDYYLSRVKEK